ncbi:RND family efflux transporter MFP subunit [Calderihabitans maritimus]|uniref:RND family efflux transporter MFP subunit n=2 Tax=Calderihabitans maritimus TaxID=1246530 RepID=A0A1Z5HSW5_9FIRM|nr:RND family efflux transporter MFP subunit [Calderihabitans maritimus]
MIILILIIVFGGGTYAYRQLVPPPEQETQGPVYSTQPVTRGDISVGVEITGTLNPSRGGSIQVPGGYGPMKPGVNSYMIAEVLVEEGTPVKQGQVIIRLSAAELETKIKSLEEQLQTNRELLAELMDVSVEKLHQVDPAYGITLRAPIDGRVVGLEVQEGDEVKQGQIVARVVDDSRFRMVVKLAPTEFKQVRTGQQAFLRFSEFNGFTKAQVTDVNPNPIPEDLSKLAFSGFYGTGTGQGVYGYVYQITVEGENPGLIRPGMVADVGLAVDSGSNSSGTFGIKWLRYKSQVEAFVKEERVISRADALATRVYVREMEMVKAGDPLVSLAGKDLQKDIEDKLNQIREQEMELQQLRAQLSQLEIRAPMDGIVARLEKQAGQTVQPGEWIGHIYNTSDMRLWGQVDDVDVLLVQQGAPVQVTVDALPGKSFEGVVERVDTMGRDENGITRFGVNIKVKGTPELRPGMQAKAYINAGSAEDVLLVPLEAIFEEDGQAKVEILQPDGMVKVVPVQLGLMNDRVAEVKSGLEEGQLVITGSTADLLPSQRIQSNDTFLPSSSENNQEQNGSRNNRTGGGQTASPGSR